MTALRQRMLEDLQIRNYAPSTIRGYILQVAQFAKHFGKSPDQLGVEHIRAYQLFLVKEGRLSQSTYIQAVCALRFLYTQTLNRQVGIERIPFDAIGMHFDDIRVAQTSGYPGFALETRGSLSRERSIFQDLECHIAMH